MVYVISKEGKPLMPTKRHGKIRILLKNSQAKVVKRNPFTIKLLYDTTNYTQPVTLGVDSGYTYIGFSATTEKKELISGECTLLKGQSERLKERSKYRGQRRNRLRHRKCRFDNRKIEKGWLAPSIQNKYESHLRFIAYLQSILPISKIIIEVANFDVQKIKNPKIEGKEYQEGKQKDFWNLREYILHRDDHKCQNPDCNNKSKDKVLEVHHIGFWKKDRTDRPSNLISLCNKCHNPRNHKESGFLWGWKPKLKSFKEATFMSVVRWRLVNSLNCEHTYGFDTKSKRIALGLEKTHYNDAFCIADGSAQTRVKPIYFEQIRRNNRSLEKFYDAKYVDSRTGEKVSGQDLNSGRTTRNKNLNSENLHKYRKQKLSKGQRRIRTQRYFYQPKDLVKYENKIYIVKGIQNKGDYIKLENLAKPVKTELVTSYEFRKGICVI